MDDAEHFYAKDRPAWRRWLETNHDISPGIWLVFDKGKNRKLIYEDIVEEALCFGWIDSRPGKVSDTQSKLYISPRKPKSGWAKTNKTRVAMLIKNGLMHPAGLKAIEVAKANGAWDALNDSDNLVLPQELIQKLSKDVIAKQNFEAFSESAKKMILEWIYSTKRDETRTARIDKTVELAAQNLKANEWRRPQ